MTIRVPCHRPANASPTGRVQRAALRSRRAGAIARALRAQPALLALAGLGLAACAADPSSGPNGEGDTRGEALPRDDAEFAFDDLMGRSGSLTEQAQNASIFSDRPESMMADELELDVEEEIACQQAGTANIVGSISIPDTESDGFESEVNAALTFQDCIEYGVSIDGYLNYWTFESRKASGDAEMIFQMDGQLDYSGDIVASCGMDFEIRVVVEAGGWLSDPNVDVEASGHFCDYPIDELEAETTDPATYGGDGGDGGDGDGGDGGQCPADNPEGEPCDDGGDCAVTCVCEAGEVEVGECIQGGCADPHETCETFCPSATGSEYRGEICEP